MAYTDIDDPSAFFQTKIYAGDNASNLVLTFDGNSDLQPDFLWQKQRGGTTDHNLVNSVIGPTFGKSSNTDESEQDNGTAYIKSFQSDGFTIGNSDKVNASSSTNVAWGWKAGTAVSGNSGGSGTAKAYSGSVNTDAGFSIIKYIGNAASGHTIPHHLGVVPKMMIIKNITPDSTNWMIYHVALGNTKAIYFTTAYADIDAGWWNNTSPTSSVFTLGNHDNHNANDNSVIAYCFAEKQGYSKFGSYVGNGNADGTFFYLGFKPAWVMLKKTTDGTSSWCIFDNKRLGRNPNNPRLYANNNNASEGASDEAYVDILSNGFKLRGAQPDINLSGKTYIYMAFAEQPFVTSTGVPATAR